MDYRVRNRPLDKARMGEYVESTITDRWDG